MTQNTAASKKKLQAFAAQFNNLDMQHPGKWPRAPKLTVYFLATVLTIVLGWGFYLSDQADALTQAMAQEDKLKNDFRERTGQVTSLAVLRQQKQLVSQYVAVLEKQLPSIAEVEGLLSEINQLGLARGLQFELFRPGRENAREFYVEQVIALRLNGYYHDIGAFASDIAALPRIVSLTGLRMSFDTDNDDSNKKKTVVRTKRRLLAEGTIKTYRYQEPAPAAKDKASAKDSGKGNTKNNGKGSDPEDDSDYGGED